MAPEVEGSNPFTHPIIIMETFAKLYKTIHFVIPAKAGIQDWFHGSPLARGQRLDSGSSPE